MRIADLNMGDYVFVRLPYEGGVGYGIVRGLKRGEVLIAWDEAPNTYYASRSPHWITSRSVVRKAKAVTA